MLPVVRCSSKSAAQPALGRPLLAIKELQAHLHMNKALILVSEEAWKSRDTQI